MSNKPFKIHICAIAFAIIQMTAELVKAIYQEHYFTLIMVGLMLLCMCWLGKWAYRQNKRKKANG